MKTIKFKLLAVCLVAFLVVGCGESKPRLTGKYTVWVGGDIISLGYHTNEYKKNDGMIEFTNIRSGKKKIVPVDSVQEIDVN